MPRASGGLPRLIVDPAAFERWDSREPIVPQEQQRLFQNLREALEFQDLKLVVEKAEPI